MNNFKFNIGEKYIDIAKLQITQVKNNEDYYLKISESEYNTIKEFIKKPVKVLELGCGLGRFSIFLNFMCQNNPHFILADFSKISSKIKYGWNPGESYYNNLQLTSEFCLEHNLNNFEIFDLANKNLNVLSDIDLVYSFLAVGFHYPLEAYIQTLKNITTKDATMIFGIRKDIYKKEDFIKDFKFVEILQNSIEDTKEEILILKSKLV